MARLVDQSGVTVFEGDIEGGGAAPVFCVLSADPIDVHAATGHPIVWNVAYDNAQDFNSIPGIPDGMGLSYVDPNFTVLETGIWASECWLDAAPDATWEGQLTNGAQLNTPLEGPITSLGGPTLSPDITGIFALPAGNTFQLSIVTAVAATANPYPMTPYLVLARIG